MRSRLFSKMATSFKKTSIRSYPTVGEKITRDTLYWKNLEFPVTVKEHGSITNIDFCPVQPYFFAITNTFRIQIYDNRTNKVSKAFSRFPDETYCGSYRSDGKLLVTGGKDAAVRLFDANTKNLLRVFKGHTGPVHVSKFSLDKVHILSASDDKTVRMWDIPSEKMVTSYSEHQDYIRCGVASQASKDIFLTGSYDHTVKMFDTRSPQGILSVDHGAPVESVLMFPGGGIFISAGGNTMKVWDALAGGKLLTQFSNHHNTITSMCFSSNYQRLLSGSLDRHVKIYDVSTYQVVHSLDYPSCVLSLAVAPDDSVIVAGMDTGMLSIQHRKPDESEKEKKKKKKASYRYELQGKTYVPSQEDAVVQHKRKEKLASYDKYFKKFEHSKALDAALDIRVRMKTPDITVSVLQELIRRGGIKAALAGRDEKSLAIILKFLQKNLTNPKYTSTLLDVSNILLDVYVDDLGQSASIDDMIKRLKETVDQEVSYMKLLLEVMGSLDTVFAASSLLEAEQSNPTDQDNANIVLNPSQIAQEAH